MLRFISPRLSKVGASTATSADVLRQLFNHVAGMDSGG